MDRELMALLGSVAGGVAVLVALGVLLVGVLVVRPRHEQAGFVLMGAGLARLLGIGVSYGLSALRGSSGGYEAAMAFGVLTTLVSMVFGVLFWGGIAFAVYRMALFAEMNRGAR